MTFCRITHKLFSAVFDNHQGKEHEGKGNDKLQAIDHKDEGAGHEFAIDPVKGQAEGTHGDNEHEGHGDVEHPALAACRTQEDSKGNEDQCGKQLIGSPKERAKC